MIELEYKVLDAGWATCEVGNGNESRLITISYLHDTLKELALSAINIRNKENQSVIFMDEPGEHKLILSKKNGSKIIYELRWYRDWASWNIIPEDDYKLILRGETTLPKYVNEVRKVLINIKETIGPKLYKEKWGEHEFPLEEYEELK